MKLTTNYSLKKPEGSDVVNIDDFNYNADAIDTKLKAIETQSNTNKTNISTLQNEVSANKTSIQSANNKIANNTKLANQALNKANEAFQRGDNVKTQLVDKLISEGLEVSTNNTFEELIGNIALGKKWANGSVAISSSKKTFNASWGGTIQEYYAEVDGLNFKPSTIILYNEAKAVRTVYNIGETYNSKQIVTSNRIHFSGASLHTYAYFTTSPCVIENGNFIVPVISTNVIAPFDMSWIAYE